MKKNMTPVFKIFKKGVTDYPVTILKKHGEAFDEKKKRAKFAELEYDIIGLEIKNYDELLKMQVSFDFTACDRNNMEAHKFACLNGVYMPVLPDDSLFFANGIKHAHAVPQSYIS